MKRQMKSFHEFKTVLENDEKIQGAFKRDPVEATKNFEVASPLTADKRVYRITVLSLGDIVILLVVGVTVLVGIGTINGDYNVPTILTAVGSAAIGALAGLLRPPMQQEEE